MCVSEREKEREESGVEVKNVMHTDQSEGAIRFSLPTHLSHTEAPQDVSVGEP